MLYSVLHYYVVCRGTRRLHGSRDDPVGVWTSGPVAMLHPRGYLMALPALTVVAVAAQRLVAANATYLILYGLGPQDLYGLGIKSLSSSPRQVGT